jgi:hypothetical protein
VSFDRLKKFSTALRKMPVQLAQKVAERASPELTGQAVASFDAGQTVYGDARPTGLHGNDLTLRKTGRLERTIRFASIGTLVRAVLSVPYAKYIIRFGILPHSKAQIPTAWSDALRDIVKDEGRNAL